LAGVDLKSEVGEVVYLSAVCDQYGLTLKGDMGWLDIVDRHCLFISHTRSHLVLGRWQASLPPGMTHEKKSDSFLDRGNE
jgi:hypothetical protein